MCVGEKTDNYSGLSHYPSAKTSLNTTTVKENYNCKEGNEFWFYNNLENSHKPLIYEHLLNSAKESICIWDPYANTNDAQLFKLINEGVDVKCLISNDMNKGNHYEKIREFISELKRIQEEKNYNLKLKVYNIPNGEKGFHDRYLFIDDDIYIVGSSMAYHNTYSKVKAASTSIHKVLLEENKKIISEIFYEYWRNEKSKEELNLYEKIPENE